MKTSISKKLGAFIAAMGMIFAVAGMSAQNSLPAPGSGGIGNPPNGIGWNPGGPGGPGGFGGPAAPPPAWGSPWGPAWNNSPTVVISPTISVGNTVNQGITKVVACGYDSTGVWRVIPLVVSYQYNGVQYSVNVLNAWNPWTDQWDKGVDVQAFNTNYILRGITYDFYTVLSFGTFYFNLN